jgi:23S rRNA pseudouridine1911/1915/1917 synthase
MLVTEYKVLEKTEGKHQEGFSYIEAYPKTGRTHQIRVHLKAINHPVVADTLYAPKENRLSASKDWHFMQGF